MIGDHDPAPKPSLEERRRTSRIRWTAGIGAVLAACLAAALAIAMTRDTTREQEGTPRLRLRPCTLGVETPARCGRLLVPENRANPSGRKISLRVAVIPSPVQPADGALFYLEGGPGGAATAVAPAVNDLFGKVNAHRDLVFVDQRGTGGSHAMQCPQEHVPLHGAPARVAGYIERCFAHLDGDPRFYTSAPAADDLEDVRKALGYGPIDLFGTSYGATLAQIFLRLHAGAVRTTTLDGASLLNVPLYELQGRNTERALDSQLARCRAQRACRTAFPSTRQEIDRLLARKPALTHPPGYTPAMLDPDGIRHTLQALLEVPYHAARLPALVHQAAGGNSDLLAVEYVTHVGVDLDGRARLAMVWEILCSEPWARFGVTATRRESQGSFLAHAAVLHARIIRAVCAVVPHGFVPPGSGRPPHSNVPVLFLAGQDDPVDPPANVAQRTEFFPNSTLIVEPAAGHGVIAEGCMALVVARFIDRGSARALDRRCLKALRPLSFARIP